MQTSDHSESREPYATGFVLALVLTVIPFGLVVAGILPPFATLVIIAILAVIQVVVHLHYFLHVGQSTPSENLLTLAFAALLIFIMIGGSLWIMLDLNARMMS